MKKLSLLLFAFCVSVAGWAQNPYAYDLKATLNANSDAVTLTYKLNADATNVGVYLLYNDGGEYRRVNKNGSEWNISNGGKTKNGSPHAIQLAMTDIPGEYNGKDLTWEVVVNGTSVTKPTIVGSVASGNRPQNAHGIAVNNNPNHTRFAQMFVSEARPSSATTKPSDAWTDWKVRADWNWAKTYDNGQYWTDNVTNFTNSNTMLEYNPQMGFVCAHHKRKHNGKMPSYFYRGDLGNYATKSHNYEPNRIKVSEDGRIFVSSFHPMSLCAVYEYTSAYDYHNVIDYNWNSNAVKDVGYSDGSKLLYKRVIGMDVKGSGRDLTILLCWIDANALYRNNKYEAQIEVWEYRLGEAEYNGDYYVNKPGSSSNKYLQGLTEDTYSRKVCTVDCDYTSSALTAGGALYQGFNFTTTSKFYYNAVRGFVDIAYGTNNDAWIKVDYAWGYDIPAKIIRVPLNNTFNTQTTTVTKNSDTSGAGFYGGSAIYVKDNRLYTSTGLGVIRVYDINNDGSLGSEKTDWRLTDNGGTTTRIGHWVTGFAEDYANNLYAVTEGYYTSNSEHFTANVVAIAMPYDGVRTTRSRNVFTASAPIPNILATDLKYEPIPGKDAYTFSFITNTKPTIAEIRFYKKNNVAKMHNNIRVIHADNYEKSGTDGTVEPDYVYRFTGEQLKRGLMSVSLNMVGGDANSKEITNALPPGELYWSVYVETTKSSSFAPIYRSGFPDKSKYQLMHATVNNYPETDMFGSLIVTNNPEYGELRSKNGLLVYRLNEDGGDGNENNYNNNTRFVKVAEHLNGNKNSNNTSRDFLNYPRRMAVAPDGKVYIADEGRDGGAGRTDVVVHTHGGVKIWDPATGEVRDFSTNILGTSTGVALYQNGNQWKLYAANTYQEFYLLGNTYDGTETTQGTKDRITGTQAYGKNGFVEYTFNNNWSGASSSTEQSLGRGDASGNMALVAMDKGVWMCQHREHTVDIKYAQQQPYADNLDNYVLSFVPYGSTTRTWRSCESSGIEWSGTAPNKTKKDLTPTSPWSHSNTAPLQSTPGAGIAYKKHKDKDGNMLYLDGYPQEYLYVVNHEGNIVKIRISNWNSNTPGLSYMQKLLTPSNTKQDITVEQEKYANQTWNTAFINSMEFDYAGNLVTITGNSIYHTSSSVASANVNHEIIVYTMPYDRTNAQEIRASENRILIPERLTYLEYNNVIIENIIKPYIEPTLSPCYVDIYRPMPNTSFSTFCLPFDLDIKQLTATEEYYGAEFKQFTGAEIVTVSNEKILELQFSDIPIEDGKQLLLANTPYIVKPKNRIPSIVKLQQPIQFVTIAEQTVGAFQFANDGDNPTTHNTISFTGVIPTKVISAENVLLLVAENRLAEMVPDDLNTNTGKIHGFRGYFTLGAPLPQGMQAVIRNKDNTLTGLIDVNGKKINIQKYLREGRVFIRVNDTLYTIDGQKVE